MFAFFKDVRASREALERLNGTLTRAISSMQDREPFEDRLLELEHARSLFEAEMEAVLLKSVGKLQAASNAEARTRTMKKSYEEADPFAPESEEIEAPVPEGDVEGEPPHGMHVLSVGMAPNDKAYALRAKFL